MADWRQIKARIRKAKASADPAAALENLYQRTRDAMVALEVAAVQEKNENREEAVKWYRTAFERFRRGTWKRKAGEALARLGEEVDLSAIPEDPPRKSAKGAGSEPTESSASFEETAIPLGDTEPDSLATEPAPVGDLESAHTPAEPARESEAAGSEAGGKKKRRRGRRGGRGRRRGKPGEAPAAPAAPTKTAPAPVVFSRVAVAEAPRRPEPEAVPSTYAVGTAYAERSGRAGDPGMASRLAKLEAQLRRLLACPEHSMDDLDNAPAGPGVFLVSDSDQVSYYYVEACRTLSIALNQMVRGRSSTGSIKSGLADHLGISESKVGDYIKKHCVVRWLQLDEDSSKLAHFAIAVLRPALND